jgi:hypothetical protein
VSVDREPDQTTPILVTGGHRTGTTWVGKMLAASGEAVYISEPLNILHRPGVLRTPTAHWYTYICADNEDQYLPGLQETLRFRYHTWKEIRSLRSLKDAGRMMRDWSLFTRGRIGKKRPLVKDPFAIFSAPWFAARLGCRVVITVRHPAAFASSLKRLEWRFQFKDLLDQPLLMRDLLEPFREEMEAIQKDDVLAQGSLLWKLIYHVVDDYRRQNPEFILVRHEDLSLDPPGGFRSLYQSLGLNFSPQVEQAVVSASSAENPGEVSTSAVHAYKLDSRSNLHNWKTRLKQDEIERISHLTAAVAASYYPEVDWG